LLQLGQRGGEEVNGIYKWISWIFFPLEPAGSSGFSKVFLPGTCFWIIFSVNVPQVNDAVIFPDKSTEWMQWGDLSAIWLVYELCSIYE
jgi:hypothetical protein